MLSDGAGVHRRGRCALKKSAALVLLFPCAFIAFGFLVAGCDLNLGDVQGPTQTVVIGAPQPTVTPRATSQAATSTPIGRVKVGYFGRSCPDGAPPEGLNDLRVGCTGDITATPLDQAGKPLPETDHPHSIRWYHAFGAAVLEAREHGTGNDFNRAARGLAVGTYKLCAIVGGVEGCVEGRVL